MSRKIKFRAYQKTPSLNHKPGLYEVTGLDFYEGDYGGGEVCLRNKKGEQWTEYIKDVVLEQSTGLKDKNGKEIYEGDIMEFGIAGAENRAVVGYEEDFGSYETYTSKGYIIAPLFTCRGKIIGNIHENPELFGGEE